MIVDQQKQLSSSFISVSFRSKITMKQIAYFSAFILASFSAIGQSELTVNCYNSDTLHNSFSIDGTIVEYGLCGLQPSFYVAVIDPSDCSAWGTNYNGANPAYDFGNFNQGFCRPRVERYFVFDAGDSLQLAGMVNMLQNVPSGHSLIVYTPISYNSASVNAVNPNLIQELEARWDPAVIQGNDIMILYAEQGNPASFVEEITQSGGQVSLSITICTSLSVKKEVIESKLVVKQDGTTLTLNPDLKIEELQIVDALGKAITFLKTGNTIQLHAGTGTGVYLLQAIASGKIYRTKQMISF